MENYFRIDSKKLAYFALISSLWNEELTMNNMSIYFYIIVTFHWWCKAQQCKMFSSFRNFQLILHLAGLDIVNERDVAVWDLRLKTNPMQIWHIPTMSICCSPHFDVSITVPGRNWGKNNVIMTSKRCLSVVFDVPMTSLLLLSLLRGVA